MISPEDIRQQAFKWWKPLLQSHILDQPFFPKSIERIGKVRPGDVTQRYEELQRELELLYRHSKNQTGTGYSVKTADRNFRRTGSHELPDHILFESIEDYVSYIGRKKEWKLFLRNYEQLVLAIPALKEWALGNTSWLSKPQICWQDVLKVCRYFIEIPRPGLYIRQLPVEVHTKFIEENDALLQSLLDFLIPDHIRGRDQRRFAERYFLKYDEPLVRIRILDEAKAMAGKVMDISLPLSDFARMDWLIDNVDNVLITENKMNFLTLPYLESTISVWSGGGFNISYLKNISWLSHKRILYWGDLDEHGLQILHQLRSYYADAKSVMMNSETFERFSQFAVNGPHNKSERLSLLDEDEAMLYRLLKSLDSGNRLEQEKIPQWYVEQTLRRLFKQM